MKRSLMIGLCGLAMAAAPIAGEAQAQKKFWQGLVGGIVAGAVIGSIVRAGQQHCHGTVCHAHGYANAYHYHDAYGTILYQAPPVYAPPPPPTVYAPPPTHAGMYPPEHYDYCFSRYRSYDGQTNSYQPFGNVPRRQCMSPYIN